MSKSVRELKGVGEKTQALLEKLGLFTTRDLVSYYPVRYENYEAPRRFDELVLGEEHTVCASPLSFPKLVSGGGKERLYCSIKDRLGKDSTPIEVIWFGQRYLASVLKPGGSYCFRGPLIAQGNRQIFSNPQVFTKEEYAALSGKRLPVYGLTKGLSNKTLIRLVQLALEAEAGASSSGEKEGGDAKGEAKKNSKQDPFEYLPESYLSRLSLMGEGQALRRIHFPGSKEEEEESRRRLVFDEFFSVLMGVAQLKSRQVEATNYFPMKRDEELEARIKALPFTLTQAQRKVLGEVEQDLCSGRLMSRLIQGDVGCGKTIVAFLAMLMAVKNGYQAALMVPTAVLAKQHYEGFVELLQGQGIEDVHPVLLTGSLTARQKRMAHEGIAMGTYKVIIGTQALISEGVEYASLGLVVIDEQHRFGVKQREELTSRGMPPHLLVMSATPIPRTLALILYGDLDISIIDALPGNRLPIKNCAVGPAWRANAYRFMEKEVRAGHQVYVICPMVEESEGIQAENVLDYVKKLRSALPQDFVLGALHGRMKPKDKDKVMEAFERGEIQILISTTVVEVGVNVPNATVMMIENAEHFGLAQLHQLRGRVGRGGHQSYCIFMQGNEQEEASKRLSFLAKTSDGFAIAGEDLKIRGQGDFFGTRQSGEVLFTLGDIYQDADILKMADEVIKEILEEDPQLSREENAGIRKKAMEVFPKEGMVPL